MIYIEELVFEPGSEEWVKIAKFMNYRLQLMFDSTIQFRGFENITSCVVSDKALYENLSKHLAPHKYSRIKANQVVMATYMLINEEGFFVPDLDMRYVLHRLIVDCMESLISKTGDTILRICDEERMSYVDCYQRLIDSGAYTSAELDPDDEVNYIEDVANYADIIFRDFDHLLYDKMTDKMIRELPVLKLVGVENAFNERFEFKDSITEKSVSYVGKLGRKRVR